MGSTLRARLAKKIHQGGPDDCWPWIGKTTVGRGYGRIADHGKSFLTHRVAYQLRYGPIDPSIKVLHTCDNPPCCNPRHLFLGTQRDNVRDMEEKRRGRHPRCEDHGRAKFTSEQIEEIRREYVYGSRTQGQAALSEKWDTSQSNIGRIVRGESWSA